MDINRPLLPDSIFKTFATTIPISIVNDIDNAGITISPFISRISCLVKSLTMFLNISIGNANFTVTLIRKSFVSSVIHFRCVKNIPIITIPTMDNMLEHIVKNSISLHSDRCHRMKFCYTLICIAYSE